MAEAILHIKTTKDDAAIKELLKLFGDLNATFGGATVKAAQTASQAYERAAASAKSSTEKAEKASIAATQKTTEQTVNAESLLSRVAAENAAKRIALASKEFHGVEHELESLKTKRQDIERAITESTDKELTKRLAAQKKEVAEELKLVNDEYKKRDEVIHGGAGAKHGVLGLKREVESRVSSAAGPLGGVVDSLSEMGPAGLAAAAAIGAVTLGIGASIKIGKEFEDSLADLRAITGLTADETEQLGEKARKMAVDFGMDAKGGVEAFKLVVSALGPDIAKDQDALAEMGRDVSTLAKASGLEAKDAVNSLTVTMSQFGFSTLEPKQQAAEMTRIMNVMAAGAKEGAAEVPDLAESMKIVGTVAKQSGVSVEGTVAAIEAMSQAGLKGGEAGTGFRNVLLDMSAGSAKAQKSLALMGLTFDDINPAKVGLTQGLTTLQEHLKAVHDPGERASIMMKLFGKENTAAANILIGSTATIADLTKKVTGTNEATEQAGIKQATFSETMKVVNAKLEDIAISVYQKIQPALNTLGKALSTTIDVLLKIGEVIGDVYGFFFRLADVIYTKLYELAIKPLVMWIGKLIAQGYEWVKSLDFVQSIVKAVQSAIGGMVDGVMKAYNAVHGFLETIGVLEKKSEKPITIQAKVELPPDEKIDVGEKLTKAPDDKAEKKAAKADKDAYTAAKNEEAIRFNQDKLDLEKRLAAKLITTDEYNDMLESLENSHVAALKDIASKHRKGHEGDAIAAESAYLKIKIHANEKEEAAEKKKLAHIEAENLKAEKLAEKRAQTLEKLDLESVKTKIASIKDENQKAIAEENLRYEEEQIARENDLMDIKTGKLIAEALETNHQNKLIAIAAQAQKKRNDSLKKEVEFFTGPVVAGFTTGFKTLMKGADAWVSKMTQSDNALESIFGNLVAGFISMIEQMVEKLLAYAATFELVNILTGGGASAVMGAFSIGNALGMASGGVIGLAEGGVMTSPTFLGMGANLSPIVGGEAGPEAVIPLSSGRAQSAIGQAFGFDKALAPLHETLQSINRHSARTKIGIPINDEWRNVNNNSAKAEDRRSF